MGAENTHETRESTEVLIGKTLEEANEYIKMNEVFFGDMAYPITSIHVSVKDGEPQQGYKDIRRSEGRMRLNVRTENGIIIRINHVG